MKNSYRFIRCVLYLLTMFSFSSGAQVATKSIKGIVVDSATKKPLEFITAALKKDNVVQKTAVTGSSGSFAFSVPPGKYTITVIAVGYNSKTTSTETDVKDETTDLGKILISSQTNKLNEVAITADRPLIKQEVDRISYDIQADPESKVLTALDMMRKVPLLSLDADDNIKLKGSGNYKILINGKPSGMMVRSPKDVLRSMPASSIQKIEVITTPPAKYDSEGLSGIINIITTKKVDNGYNGSLNLREQAPFGPGVGGNLTAKFNKFGVNAYGGVGTYNAPETEILSSRITTGSSPSSLINNGTRKNENLNGYGGAEFSYEIDTLNLLTAEINPYAGHFKGINTQAFNLSDATTITTYDLLTNNKYNWSGLESTLNYQRGFKGNKDRLLTFSYKFSNNVNPQSNDLMFTNRQNYTDPNYQQQNDSHSKEQTIQIDYVHPLKKLTIEGGLKGILRDNNSNFETRNFNEADGNYVLDPTKTNTFNNNQDILGAYNSYTYNLKQWGFKGGVRLEGTFVNADFVSTSSNVKTDYFNLIPTISINHKFKNTSTLNFGFTQRIERPGIYNLNPFVDRTSPNFESTGNPDLEAVLSNNFNLAFNTFKKGNINIGLSYNFANNTIQNVSVYNEATKITRSTYLNIGRDKSLSTDLNVTYPITPKWNFSLNGNLGYSWIQGSIDGTLAKNDGLLGYFSINTGYKFEHNWRLNANFNYSAPEVLLQGTSSSYVYLGISGSKDIIKDKLSISASVNNPFAKYRYYSIDIEGANFIQSYRGQNYNRSFSTSLNWKFGRLKDSVVKSKRSINNDDVKGSGGKSGT
jgi:outer membrane receptor protein involved in Fe transport